MSRYSAESPPPVAIVHPSWQVLRTGSGVGKELKENGFIFKKKVNRRYPEESMIDADYADDRSLLLNTHAYAECPLHSLEQAARGMGRYIDAVKTEFMCFKQVFSHSHIKWLALEISRPITYLGSYISSTESDVNLHIVKASVAIDRQLII